MARPAYSELLKDPRWQRRRLEVMERAQFECQTCGTAEKTLAVHHRIYRKGAKPWEYSDRELQCLCADCHEAHHCWRQRLDEALSWLDPDDIERVVGFAQATVLLRVVNQYPDAALSLWTINQALGTEAAGRTSLVRAHDLLDACEQVSKREVRITAAHFAELPRQQNGAE